MKDSIVQADFQLMDNYISEFSLNIFDKIVNDVDLDISANVGFGIVNINEEEMIGQIELKYDIDIIENEQNVAKIIITMNALFQGSKNINIEQFEQMLKINGATTLSHLCRAYISTTTSLSGMPTITLPLMNFCKFFEDAKEENS